jgi:hypothetical protein
MTATFASLDMITVLRRKPTQDKVHRAMFYVSNVRGLHLKKFPNDFPSFEGISSIALCGQHHYLV